MKPLNEVEIVYTSQSTSIISIVNFFEKFVLFGFNDTYCLVLISTITSPGYVVAPTHARKTILSTFRFFNFFHIYTRSNPGKSSQ